MTVSQTITAIWPFLRPLTQQMLSEWASTSRTFAQQIMRYGGIERGQIVHELAALGVLVWVHGMPEFVPLPL